MTVLLCGANPGARLFDGDTVTAFASVWTVDWSVRGAGAALVLWHGGRVRVLGADPELAGWLADYFVRHFPEVDGLPWPAPTVERADVAVGMDLGSGLHATAADVEVAMSGVLDRRTFRTGDFPLDGVPHGLQLLLTPMAEATITVAGQRLPGAPKVSGTSSSAFLAAAEVWSR